MVVLLSVAVLRRPQVIVKVVWHALFLVLTVDFYGTPRTRRVVASLRNLDGLEAVKGCDRWVFLVLEHMEKGAQGFHNSIDWRWNLQGSSPALTNEHAIAVHMVAHKLAVLSHHLNASRPPSGIACRVKNAA